MEVQGVTPQRVDEVEDASITGGVVDSSGNLVLQTHGGINKNAGSVVRPLFSWPVGSVYIGTTSTSPAVLFGGGTWERFGKGRVLVGVDEDDADAKFNAALKTGGAKTHKLTAAEMPVHNHGGATGGQSVNHEHTGFTTTDGPHEHNYSAPVSTNNKSFGGSGDIGAATPSSTSGGGGHGHNIATNGANVDHTHSIGNTGGGEAHNNLQPYIVVYMWRRTA